MLLSDWKKEFDQIYAIYKQSFPDCEQRTRDGQKFIMESPYYRLAVKREKEEIVAFAGYWELPGCIYLEHLAVDPSCRGKGYGQELVKQHIITEKKYVFLEIEPITSTDPFTSRRAEFYKRMGFCVNQFPYLQPPLKEGDCWVPLWILSYGNPVEESLFLPFKKQIYEYAYQISLI